jgi:hypothetical protein
MNRRQITITDRKKLANCALAKIGRNEPLEGQIFVAYFWQSERNVHVADITD